MPLDDALAFGAVELFVRRAERVAPGAASRFEEVLARARARGHVPQVPIASHNLGSVEARRGDDRAAGAHYREALAINRRRGNRRSVVDPADRGGTLESAP